MNFFKYIELGMAGAEVVASFITLIALKKPLTGPEIAMTISPIIVALQAGWKIQLPKALVDDISAAVATAIDKYVFHTGAEDAEPMA